MKVKPKSVLEELKNLDKGQLLLIGGFPNDLLLP